MSVTNYVVWRPFACTVAYSRFARRLSERYFIHFVSKLAYGLLIINCAFKNAKRKAIVPSTYCIRSITFFKPVCSHTLQGCFFPSLCLTDLLQQKFPFVTATSWSNIIITVLTITGPDHNSNVMLAYLASFRCLSFFSLVSPPPKPFSPLFLVVTESLQVNEACPDPVERWRISHPDLFGRMQRI